METQELKKSFAINVALDVKHYVGCSIKRNPDKKKIWITQPELISTLKSRDMGRGHKCGHSSERESILR